MHSLIKRCGLPLKSLLGPMRLPFLLLTPACVAVGVGTAHLQTGDPHWMPVLLVLVGALASHISVNAFNEYFDFRSGLDAKTERTPFSGGSGTLPSHPELARSTLWLAVAALTFAALIGLYFIWLRGWLLLPLGVFGLVLAVTYTTWWANRPILCLIAPGLGFGVLMVMGTHFSLTGSYTWPAFAASLLPSFLVSNLLLLNQFPDVAADRSVGRRNFPVLYGRPASARLYGVLLLMAYASVVTGVWLGLLPRYCLLALVTAPVAFFAWQGASKHADDIPALIPAMRLNVLINLATPLLLALGLFVG
jgi:1,4-dihydroxy-2-naphthoate octaprenyltransferase